MEDKEMEGAAGAGRIVDAFVLSENLAAVRTLDVPADPTGIAQAPCHVAFLHLNDEFDPVFRYDAELEGDALAAVLDGTSADPVPEAVKRLVTEPVRERSMWAPVTAPATAWMEGEPTGPLADIECLVAAGTGSEGADVRAVLSAAARSVGTGPLVDDDPARSRTRARAALAQAARAKADEGEWQWVAARSRFELVGAGGAETACLVPVIEVADGGAVSIAGWSAGCTEPFAADPTELLPSVGTDRDSLMRDAEVMLLNRYVDSSLPASEPARSVAPVGGAGTSLLVDTEALFSPLASGSRPGEALEIRADGTLRPLRPLLVAEGGRDAYLIDQDERVVSVKASQGGPWPVVEDGDAAAADYRARLVEGAARAVFVSTDAKGERRGLMAACAPASPAAAPGPARASRIEVETGHGTLVAVAKPKDDPAPGVEVWLESHDRTVLDQIVIVDDQGGEGPNVSVNDGEEPRDFEVDPFGGLMQRPAAEAGAYVARSGR